MKQIRHCWLILMLCWPARSPWRASSLLPGRHPQIFQRLGGVEYHQLAQRDPFDPRIE
ncbi:MAG: hypothetical protein WBB78_01195 [Propionicimonas sp.]